MVRRRAQRPLLLGWQGSRVWYGPRPSIMLRLQAQRTAAATAVAAAFGIVVTAAEQAVPQGNLSPLVTTMLPLREPS